ncbi:MAG: TonB-dependent siderophore receptor [Bacteroidota bacterium]|nr:TonB-dependent siderophore receptor [Bacteroidota bacterium]
MKTILLTLISSFVFYSAHAQTDKGNITGKIKDKTGKSVELANILVENTAIATYTDESGKFTLKNIPQGNYTIIASVVGFEPIKQNVSVKAGETTTISFTIAEKVHKLKEVSITSTGIKGEIKDIPGTVSVIDSKQIQESGAQNIGQIINRVPGVNYLDEDGRGLKPNIGLRGLDPLRNRNLLVLMDGKFPIGMTYYGDPASYYMTPVQSVDRIEVIKGASPVLYGGYSVGGVVNMITKKGKFTPETKADLSYGSFNSLNAQLSTSGNNGKVNYMISGLYRQGDGFRDRSKFNVNDFTINLGTILDSTSEISLYLNGFSEDSETPGGLTQAQYDADLTQSQHTSDHFYSKRFSTALSYKKTYKKYHTFSTSVYGNYFVRDWWIAYKNPTNSGALRDIHAIGNVSDYNFTKNIFKKKNSLIVGVRIHSDRLDNMSIAGADKEARTGTTTANDVNTSFIYEGYIYDEFGITKNLTIAPGIRYTNINYKRNDFIKKRKDEINAEAFVYSGGLIYKLFEHSRIYATISKGFQPPTLNSALSPGTIDAGVDLKPETSINYEAGFRTDPFSWLSLNASVYKMDFTNKVISESGINKNAGGSYHRGIETELELGAWKGISLFANGTLQKATFTNGADSGKFLPNAPQQMAALGVRYKFPLENQSLIINVFNNYVGKQYSDSKNTEEGSADGKFGAVPTYNVMNATINYSRKHWGVYVNVNNLLDEKYFTLRWASWNGIIPSPGRNFMVGAQIKF